MQTIKNQSVKVIKHVLEHIENICLCIFVCNQDKLILLSTKQM